MKYLLKIQKNVCNDINLTLTRMRYKRKYKLPRTSWKHYDNKLDCSISRAKNTIINICQFNRFYFFFTLTINSCYDRKDLKSFINRFNNVVKYLNKKHNTKEFYYLFVPELHMDDTNFHIHGFLSEAFSKYLSINVNGFPCLTCFKKLGFDSISKIRDYNACIHYCLKYICKDIVSMGLGQHLYYCSNGLSRDNVIDLKSFTQIPPIHFDFTSEYCMKTSISLQEYYNFVTSLDRYDNMTYYNYS